MCVLLFCAEKDLSGLCPMLLLVARRVKDTDCWKSSVYVCAGTGIRLIARHEVLSMVTGLVLLTSLVPRISLLPRNNSTYDL